MSQKPRSVLNPTSTKNPSINELEYLDVFDFFNYPRSSTTMGKGENASEPLRSALNLHASYFRPTEFTTPNPESGWLVFKPPYD